MNDKPENKENMDKALFANLIMMLSSSAMQQMGNTPNPITQKTEINLEGAQLTIDMLEMLKNRTEGNLDAEESKMTTDILSSLQMAYVQASQTEGEKQNEKGDEAETVQEPADSEKKPEEDSSGEEKDSGKDPKYHKSYG
ncbi:MAG: DUF1844 domain-containing protein [Kiritimatiellia bacterium]